MPEPVEVAAYYVVSETPTNAAKHANASSVSVDVEIDERPVRSGGEPEAGTSVRVELPASDETGPA